MKFASAGNALKNIRWCLRRLPSNISSPDITSSQKRWPAPSSSLSSVIVGPEPCLARLPTLPIPTALLRMRRHRLFLSLLPESSPVTPGPEKRKEQPYGNYPACFQAGSSREHTGEL